MRLILKKSLTKKILLASVLVLLSAVFTHLQLTKNPLPPDIKKQLSYKAIYPASNIGVSNDSSYHYQPSTQTLTFELEASGTKVVVVEQPAPDSLSSNGQVYYPALGIHPYAQFQSTLGPVALTKFWQISSLQPGGQTAVLAAQGTLLLARPDKDLSNDQWKDFFKSLKITR